MLAHVSDHLASMKKSYRSSSRRNVEELEVPSALKVQPQGEVTNEFREAIQMFSQMVTNHVGQQRRARLKEDNTSRTHEFLRMNPPNFTG